MKPIESLAVGDPPTTAVDSPARDVAEAGRDVRVSPWVGQTAVAAPTITAVADGGGRVFSGVQREARTPGMERVPVRGDMKGAEAASAVVTHSPIRTDSFLAERSNTASLLLSSAAATVRPPRAEIGTDDRDNDNDNISGDEGDDKARQQERLALERLAEAAAGEFRQQRDKRSALRLLTAWRCATVRERSKREALSRLVRDSRKRQLSGGWGLWRAGARLARIKEERRAAREGAVAAAAATKEAVAAAAEAVAATGAAAAEKAAAERLVRQKEKELQLEKTAREELLKTVEKLQAEVCAGVHAWTRSRQRPGLQAVLLFPYLPLSCAQAVDMCLLFVLIFQVFSYFNFRWVHHGASATYRLSR